MLLLSAIVCITSLAPSRPILSFFLFQIEHKSFFIAIITIVLKSELILVFWFPSWEIYDMLCVLPLMMPDFWFCTYPFKIKAIKSPLCSLDGFLRSAPFSLFSSLLCGDVSWTVFLSNHFLLLISIFWILWPWAHDHIFGRFLKIFFPKLWTHAWGSLSWLGQIVLVILSYFPSLPLSPHGWWLGWVQHYPYALINTVRQER